VPTCVINKSRTSAESDSRWRLFPTFIEGTSGEKKYQWRTQDGSCHRLALNGERINRDKPWSALDTLRMKWHSAVLAGEPRFEI
jgi:hypothetical protein